MCVYMYIYIYKQTHAKLNCHLTTIFLMFWNIISAWTLWILSLPPSLEHILLVKCRQYAFCTRNVSSQLAIFFGKNDSHRYQDLETADIVSKSGAWDLLAWHQVPGQLFLGGPEGTESCRAFSKTSAACQDFSRCPNLFVASFVTWWPMVTLASCACSCCVATQAAAAKDMMPSDAQECKVPLNVILNLRHTKVIGISYTQFNQVRRYTSSCE